MREIKCVDQIAEKIKEFFVSADDSDIYNYILYSIYNI